MSAIVFEHPNYEGAHRHVLADVSNLHPEGWGDRISSICVLEGDFVFFEHDNYTGQSKALGPGAYPNLTGWMNDQISSIKAPQRGDFTPKPLPAGSPPSMIVFENPNFGGAHRHVFGDVLNLHFEGMGDKISSVYVFAGEWLLYEHDAYNGQVLKLGPGAYPEITGFMNDQISSIRGPVGEGRLLP